MRLSQDCAAMMVVTDQPPRSTITRIGRPLIVLVLTAIYALCFAAIKAGLPDGSDMIDVDGESGHGRLLSVVSSAGAGGDAPARHPV